jgi:hypothetical protein
LGWIENLIRRNILVNFGMIQISVVAMEIGQKVRVRRLRDRVSQDVAKRLGQIGIVQDYKMVDGSGVGMLVQFDDKTATWFFEDELEQFN